jgi:hypothetical protein
MVRVAIVGPRQQEKEGEGIRGGRICVLEPVTAAAAEHQLPENDEFGGHVA